MRSLLPLFWLFPALALAQPQVQVQLVSGGFEEPLDIDHAGDARLFITERAGIIRILHPDTTITTFLDITDRVGSAGGEQGLLGLAFHPNYALNGYFYVNYTDTFGDTHLARFNRSGADPAVADPASELTLFTMDQPAANHNGGDLKFGPDGYLYIFMGDGGGTGHNRSQNLSNFFGKILRIDVDGGTPYAIPPDNPFVGVSGADEIFAIGLRNPWRNSFDRLTGDLYIGDVGGDSWEEIDVIRNDTAVFMNFGWKCYEGNMLRPGTLCDTIVPDFDFPVFEYPHDIATGGFAVTGGFVYRGTEHPGMYGKYFFCDYISGNWWMMQPDGAGGYTTELLGFIIDRVTGFGENVSGELFVCINETGEVYRVSDACSAFSHSALVTDAAAPTAPNGAIDIVLSGETPPVTYEWSNGATTQDISGVFPGTYTFTATDATGCITTGTYMVDALCNAATGITTAPTATTVFINWDDMGASGYRVMYKPVTGGAWIQVNTPVSQITLSGLSPSTAYTFRIRHKCPGAPGTFTSTGNFITTPLRTGMPELAVFPNPAQTLVHITGVPENSRCVLMDLQGRVVAETRCGGSDGNTCSLDISAVAEGIYVVWFPDLEAVPKKIHIAR